MRIGYLTVPPTMPGREAAPRARSCSPRSRPATRSRTPCSSTRSRTSRGSRSTSARSSGDATGSCRRSASSATSRRCPRARSTSWPARRSPDDRAFAEHPRQRGRARPAGHGRRGPGLVPHQPHRLGPDGRGRDPALRGGDGGGDAVAHRTGRLCRTSLQRVNYLQAAIPVGCCRGVLANQRRSTDARTRCGLAAQPSRWGW